MGAAWKADRRWGSCPGAVVLAWGHFYGKSAVGQAGNRGLWTRPTPVRAGSLADGQKSEPADGFEAGERNGPWCGQRMDWACSEGCVGLGDWRSFSCATRRKVWARRRVTARVVGDGRASRRRGWRGPWKRVHATFAERKVTLGKATLGSEESCNGAREVSSRWR